MSLSTRRHLVPPKRIVFLPSFLTLRPLPLAFQSCSLALPAPLTPGFLLTVGTNVAAAPWMAVQQQEADKQTEPSGAHRPQRARHPPGIDRRLRSPV
jgi:hypothetical protein